MMYHFFCLFQEKRELTHASDIKIAPKCLPSFIVVSSFVKLLYTLFLLENGQTHNFSSILLMECLGHLSAGAL